LVASGALWAEAWSGGVREEEQGEAWFRTLKARTSFSNNFPYRSSMESVERKVVSLVQQPSTTSGDA